MTNFKLLTAAALVFAAAGAYAGTDDGNVQGNVAPQVVVSQQAPAPSASAAETEVRTQDSSVVSPNP
ncbi:MAG: hypothetical protein JWN73_1696 [Betaproteobacteria bacterium]|nr:hypothetical protein [Betaproteobacteria bacterium]